MRELKMWKNLRRFLHIICKNSRTKEPSLCPLLLILCCFVFGFRAQAEITIAVGSDLHLDLENNNEGVINPLVQYNGELIDAFLWDVMQQEADVLLLCGDLTNAGRSQQHQALAKKLSEAKQKGIQIYLIPGNHDIDFSSAEDFAKIYEEFGFRDARSRDKDSLSYSLLLDKRLFLMLDTDGYSKRTEGAYLSDETLKWIEGQLVNAAKNEWQIFVVGHYPILTYQPTPFEGKEKLEKLLREYEIPLYVCGHQHQRGVVCEDGLTELVVEQPTSYPCSYAVINIDGQNSYHYLPRKVDVSAWAQIQKSVPEPLKNFDELQDKLFRERCEATVIALKRDKEISQKDLDLAVEFFWEMQSEFWQGILYYNLEEVKAHPGYEIFMDLAEGTTYGYWIPIFMDSVVPETAGFTLSQ